VTLPEGATEARLRFLGTGSAFGREFTAPVVRVTPRMNLVIVRYANGTVMASAPPHEAARADAGRMR
jgi:hypothetical protein